MIKYKIGYDLNILFIGINPHPGSYRRGVPFSNNKMFWYLLHDAGLLHESREILRNDEKLKHLYEYSFKQNYHFGFLNIFDKPTRTAAEVKKTDVLPGIERALSAIKKYEPLVACFIGKVTYSLFIGSSRVSYGWQNDIASSKVYIMHAPNRGLASIRIEELKTLVNQYTKMG